MYLGHLTNLVRSLLGWTAPPMPNLLGVFSNSPLFWMTFFFPVAFFAVPVFFCAATFLG